MIEQAFFSHDAIDRHLGSNALLFLRQDRHDLAPQQIRKARGIVGGNHFLALFNGELVDPFPPRALAAIVAEFLSADV